MLARPRKERSGYGFDEEQAFQKLRQLHLPLSVELGHKVKNLRSDVDTRSLYFYLLVETHMHTGMPTYKYPEHSFLILPGSGSSGVCV